VEARRTAHLVAQMRQRVFCLIQWICGCFSELRIRSSELRNLYNELRILVIEVRQPPIEV